MRRIYIFLLLGILLVFSLTLVAKGKRRHDTASSAAPSPVVQAETRPSDPKTGSIHGRVIYQGNPPQPHKLMVVKDVAVCGKVDHYDERLVVGTDKGVKDAVISLVGVTGGKTLDSMGTEFVLDQRICSYQPHILVVPVNTPIRVLNNDGVLHNIHTYSTKNQPMNIAQPGTKKRLNVVFDTPERISVRCDIHGWMSGWVVVVDHPYHAVTDATGKFTINGIPPGTYAVNCWQEMLGEQTAQVIVAENDSASVDFNY